MRALPSVRSLWLAASLSIAVSVLITPASQATPAFTRQTGMSCAQCHTDMPALTETGRMFKMGGYTSADGTTSWPPIATMIQGGFTHTKSGVPGGPSEHFKPNDNPAVGQASLFYSGQIFGPYTPDPLKKLGIFAQATYDGVGRALSWDNVELRWADKGKFLGQDVMWGIYANNNPTMQDPWHTLPTWGFPFATSPLAATPSAATLIDGGLSQQVLGIGAYTLWNKHWYIDIGGYKTLGSGFQKAMGVDPEGESEIAGVAPYWRLAYTTKWGSSSWELGTFGMGASTYPGRDRTAGKDRHVDWGIDTQYQTAFGENNLLALLSWTHEQQRWSASQVLGGAEHSRGDLWRMAATVDVLHDKTYGAAVQYFVSDGTRDALAYPDSPNGSPYSDGIVAELNWLPFHKKGGPSFLPNMDLKLSVQYIFYNHFNGTSTGASANNTLFVGAWLSF